MPIGILYLAFKFGVTTSPLTYNFFRKTSKKRRFFMIFFQHFLTFRPDFWQFPIHISLSTPIYAIDTKPISLGTKEHDRFQIEGPLARVKGWKKGQKWTGINIYQLPHIRLTSDGFVFLKNEIAFQFLWSPGFHNSVYGTVYHYWIVVKPRVSQFRVRNSVSPLNCCETQGFTIPCTE